MVALYLCIVFNPFPLGLVLILIARLIGRHKLAKSLFLWFLGGDGDLDRCVRLDIFALKFYYQIS